MIRITTWCPQCGRVELGTDDITLVVSPFEDNAWYQFDCLGCVQRVVKPAPSAVVSALTRAHVAVSILPAEALERAQLGQDRSMTVDDLLDALLWLRSCSDPGHPPTHPLTPRQSTPVRTARTRGPNSLTPARAKQKTRPPIRMQRRRVLAADAQAGQGGSAPARSNHQWRSRNYWAKTLLRRPTTDPLIRLCGEHPWDATVSVTPPLCLQPPTRGPCISQHSTILQRPKPKLNRTLNRQSAGQSRRSIGRTTGKHPMTDHARISRSGIKNANTGVDQKIITLCS